LVDQLAGRSIAHETKGCEFKFHSIPSVWIRISQNACVWNIYIQMEVTIQ